MHFSTTASLYFLFATSCILSVAPENIARQDPDINVTISQIFSRNATAEELNRRMVTYCDTPNNDKAFCMPILNCTKLLKQIDNKNAASFLQASRCGPKNENVSNPLVCCGKYSNFQQDKNLFPKSCGYQNVTVRGRILGGKQAVLGEFPWLARLFHRDKAGTKVFGCSGFLISSRFVLTAGHCLQSENLDVLGPIFEVHLGEHDTKSSRDCNSKNICADKVQVIRVNSTMVHHSYNMSSRHHHNDIGLIYLRKPAKFTLYVSPICLLEKADFEPFEYWLSGWGTTETENLSHIKLKVSVPPFPHSNCSKEYEKIRVKVIDKQMCAGGKKNKDSCTGDSGGPLMLVVDGNHWFAAGVVSYGLGCGREGWPAIYTNITSYSGWIKKTMSKYVKNGDKIKTKAVKHHKKNNGNNTLLRSFINGRV